MKTAINFAAAGFALAVFASAAIAQEIRSYPLPPALSYPEGIGFDPDGYIYNVGAADGTVVRTNLRNGQSDVVAKPGVVLPVGHEAFPGILGMKLDSAKRLWLTGGRTGKIFVLDTRSGKLVKTLTVPGEGGLFNDAVITSDAVYFTDTLRPMLWKIALKGNDIGEPEVWIDLKGTPIEHAPGANLNGIAKTTDNKTIFVVQMNKGLLFKIDVATKAITPIDVGGETVTGGDGLELDGYTLYVVRQPDAEVVTIALAPGLASGKVVSRFKDPALKWPATAVKVGNELLIVNSQFNKRNTKDPVTPFDVVAVPLSKLGGK